MRSIMGEAKRRKLLDPNYGKPKPPRYADMFRLNSKEILNIEVKQYIGTLNYNGDDYYTLNVDCTDDESLWIEDILSEPIGYIFNFYGKHIEEYVFYFNFESLLEERRGTIQVFPASWVNEPPQDRLRLEIVIEMKDGEGLETIRKHPCEHIRKAHKRRVRYGKGWAFEKWVEIDETTVNKSIK